MYPPRFRYEAPRTIDSGHGTPAVVASAPSTAAEVAPSVVREPEVAEATEAPAASSASATPVAQTATKKRPTHTSVESSVIRAPAKPAKGDPAPDPASDPFLRRR